MKLALAILLAASGALADGDDAMGRRVQTLLRAHQADVFGCVGKQRGTAAGEALLRVVVGAGGLPARVEVLRVDDGAPVTRAAADCVAAAARSWDLSSLQAAAGDQVVFPLVFRPAADETARSSRGVEVSVRVVKLAPKVRLRAGRITGGAVVLVSGRVELVERARGARRTLVPGDVIAWRAGWAVELDVEKGQGEALVVEQPGMPVKDTWPTQVSCAGKKAYPIAGGRGTVRLCLEDDGDELGLRAYAPVAVDLMSAQAGVTVPEHRHEGSDEVVYVIAGRGATFVDGVGVPFGPGTVVAIPKGAEHGLRVDEALEAVQIYSPAGPEQRFKTAVQK